MTVTPENPLSTRVETLSDIVGQLRQSVLLLSTRLRRTRVIALGTTIGLVIDLILSVGMIYFAASVEHQQHNTCTLYGFVISSYNEVSRGKSPTGPVMYDNFYRQMQTAADDNSCGIPHKV